ncbi:MAG: hypothetical protein ACHWZW_00110 [Spirulina sp.]
MKAIRQTLTLSAVTLAVALASGPSLAQAVAQTPLVQPLQIQGSVRPSQPSTCGVLPTEPTQVLEVTEDFAAISIATSGSPGLTLFVEGPNGFSECHITSDAAGTVNAPGLLNRGRYRFYVGNANPVPTAYQLTLSQD